MWAENTTFTARSGNGDAVSRVRLLGRVVRKGQRFNLDAAYSPEGQFYRDQPVLNRLVQEGNLGAGWQLSPVDTLRFSGRMLYSPEQGISQGAAQGPIVFTRFTDRRTLTATLGYNHAYSARTDLVTDVRGNFQTFSEPSLVDSAGTGVGVRIRRKLAPRTSLDFGVGNSWSRFVHTEPADRDPNTGVTLTPAFAVRGSSQVTSPFLAIVMGVGARTTLSGRLGYNVANPSDPGKSTHHGLLVDTSLAWQRKQLNAAGGYNRDISSGAGTTALSRSESWYTSLGYDFTARLHGLVAFNRTSNASLARGSGGFSTRSMNGDASVSYRTGRITSVSSGFSRFIQGSRQPNAPDLATNRYTVGLLVQLN